MAGYDRLGAREAMRGLLDLPEPLLRRLLAWEVLHRRRTQVLRAIRRALDRLAARASALRGSAGVPVAEGTAGSAASRRARVR